MDEAKILQAIENGLIKQIQSGEAFKMSYVERIDITEDLVKIFKKIDYNVVFAKVKENLEEEIARKIVNKVVTELGNDMKKIMCNAEIREDFKYFMRQGVETILGRVTKHRPADEQAADEG